MKARASNGVTEIKRNGVSVRIRPTVKDGAIYFVVDYRVLGQRKLVWLSSMADARAAADDAIAKITEGQGEILNLKSTDAHAYTRARAALAGIEKEIDHVASEYADAYRLLAGRATIGEACRYWLKRNAVELPRVTVADAVTQLKIQTEKDGKSKDRQIHLASHLAAFASAFNCEVHTIAARQVSDYLVALPFVERTKANHREDLGFLNLWLVLRGYLAKGTDWL